VKSKAQEKSWQWRS